MSDPTPDNLVVSPVEVVPEEEKEYIETAKFNDWFSYYTDKSNKTTYHNGTQAALAAYNTVDYMTGANIGSKNLKKAKRLAMIHAQENGYTLEKMTDLGLALMLKRGMAPSWIEMMEFIGYKDPKEETIGASLKIGDAEMKVVINRVV